MTKPHNSKLVELQVEVTRANAPEFNHLEGEEIRLHEGQLSQSIVTLRTKHITYFISNKVSEY